MALEGETQAWDDSAPELRGERGSADTLIPDSRPPELRQIKRLLFSDTQFVALDYDGHREPVHLPRARPRVTKWLLHLRHHTCFQGRRQGKAKSKRNLPAKPSFLLESLPAVSSKVTRVPWPVSRAGQRIESLLLCSSRADSHPTGSQSR